MNQTQKNYTIRRLTELAEAKKALIRQNAQEDLSSARKRIKPETWKQLDDAAKSRVIAKAIKDKRLKQPKVEQILRGTSRSGYQDENLRIIFPGIDRVIAEVNAESIKTRAEFKEVEKRARDRQHNVGVRLTAVCDEVMLGQGADACLQAIKAFEAEDF